MYKLKNLISSFSRNKFSNREFVKNSVVLTAGTFFAQMIPILISPILSRLYKPEDYGLLALFTSIASLIGIIAAARYEVAIVLPKKNNDAINIVFLSASVVILTTVISFLIFFFLNNPISTLLKNPEISIWLYFIPAVIFLSGFYQILSYWTIRTKQFKHLTFSKITHSFTGSASNLTFGFFNFGAPGLIAGSIIGQAASMLILFLQSFSGLKKYFGFVTKNNMTKEAKIHKDFPTINSIQAFTDVLRDSLTVFLISYLFNSAALGLYSFTLRVLKTPAALVGTSVSQVFLQRASEMKNDSMDMKVFVKKMILRLSIIAFPVFAFLLFFAPVLFAFVFGEKWREAGIYTQILSPWLFCSFIASPVSTIPIIMGKQKSAFKFSLTGSFILILSILAGALIFKNIYICFIILTLTQSTYLIYFTIWIIKISEIKSEK